MHLFVSSYCVDDKQYIYGPSKLKTSTISDEMKVSSHGKSIIYSVAASKDAAILSAGHAADNALWYDDALKKMEDNSFLWCFTTMAEHPYCTKNY